MKVNGVPIRDTYAEAFDMWATRLVITAVSQRWARIAAEALTGFATSVIGCKVEAGIEADLAPEATPDARPGEAVLLFAFSPEDLGKRAVERVGQTVLTCASAACFEDDGRRALTGADRVQLAPADINQLARNWRQI